MGDFEKARQLFESHNNVSAFICDMDGNYPIHLAVLGGHIKVIYLLASTKFLVNAKGQNIVHVATLTGNNNVVRCLLNTMPEVDSLINQKDDDGNTPLHLAILEKHVRVVELLLQDVRVNVGILNKEALTAYDLANNLMMDYQDTSTLERYESVDKCAIDGILLNFLYKGDESEFRRVLSERSVQLEELRCLEDGSNILHFAASMNTTSLEFLINGLDPPQVINTNILVEQANNPGDLPLHRAILIDGIYAWKNIKGNTPLHIAVLNKQSEIATLLRDKCPRVAYSLNKDNICPLFLSILYWRDSHIVTQMINDLDGDTIPNYLKGAKSVIHAAIFIRSSAILESIVNKNSLLLDSHDSKGRSPISYAAHIGYTEGVKFLLTRDPDLEFKRDKDEDGSFPIHQATKGGQLEIIKLLHPETGRVDVVSYLLQTNKFKKLLNTGDEDGNTPLHLAVKALSYSVVHLLTLEEDIECNSLNNELLTAKDMFYRRLQHLDDKKVPSFL